MTDRHIAPVQSSGAAAQSAAKTYVLVHGAWQTCRRRPAQRRSGHEAKIRMSPIVGTEQDRAVCRRRPQATGGAPNGTILLAASWPMSARPR
jgi:hypothetical protein